MAEEEVAAERDGNQPKMILSRTTRTRRMLKESKKLTIPTVLRLPNGSYL
jgi:hypothetical protein